ncbi:hypothetical protein [Iodobacter violaceini]|nr:hypothetical protein [Iodobacter violacea]
MENPERVFKSFIVILPFILIYNMAHFFMSNIENTKTTFSLLFDLPLMIMTLPWSIWLTSGVEILLESKFHPKTIQGIITVILFSFLWMHSYFFVGFIYFGKLVKWGVVVPAILLFLFIFG